MIHKLKVQDNWILHTVTEKNDSMLSDPQIDLLHSCFNGEEVEFITSMIKKKIESMEKHCILQIEILPIQVFFAKADEKTFIALSMLKKQVENTGEKEEELDVETFIARSAKMKEVMEIVKKISYVDSSILLLGKSGVGKSMIAKLIHKYSTRAKRNFISINCGAIPEALMEAELFGYTHGSFTGGQRGGKKGIFESADEGTVFLDEVGELPLNLQVKLLEVLQENCIRPIGETKLIPVNVRVIAATNQNLLELVQQKKFREDLYYRLNVVPIEIPPLCDRIDDIPHLTRHFLKQKINKYGIFKTFHPEVEEVFKRYEWPGNVRELENIIERLFITTEENEIQLTHLPSFFHSLSENASSCYDKESDIVPLKKAKKMLEKELIVKAYDLYKSTYKAARALQVDQSTIVKKLKEFREEGR